MSTPAPTPHVRGEWGRRIEAEYRSAAITQHLALWLIQIGASPDLITDALRIVTDELTHSEMSHAVFVEAGGTEPPRIDRAELQLTRHGDRPLEADVLRVAVQVFCLGETVAVPLFKHMRQSCTVPVAREALDRILRDEVRHRDFGWDMLDWFLDSPIADDVVAQIDAQLMSMFVGMRRNYGMGDVPGNAGTISDDERAWGLAPAGEYADILDRCVARDYVPRFADRGIDALPAWDASASHV